MPIRIGNTELKDIRLGNTEVKEVRLGNTVVWRRTPPGIAPTLSVIPNIVEAASIRLVINFSRYLGAGVTQPVTYQLTTTLHVNYYTFNTSTGRFDSNQLNLPIGRYESTLTVTNAVGSVSRSFEIVARG